LANVKDRDDGPLGSNLCSTWLADFHSQAKSQSRLKSRHIFLQKVLIS
jgi:hypothetical protein